MPSVDTVRVILPRPQIIRVAATFPTPIVLNITGVRIPTGTSITPLPTRPTTLNEVILGGVTLGLWP